MGAKKQNDEKSGPLFETPRLVRRNPKGEGEASPSRISYLQKTNFQGLETATADHHSGSIRCKAYRLASNTRKERGENHGIATQGSIQFPQIGRTCHGGSVRRIHPIACYVVLRVMRNRSNESKRKYNETSSRHCSIDLLFVFCWGGSSIH